ncbi:MAG: aldehyde dehydrogenase family protein, partial [SAR116 cluster bacterium]|nr:aldehyde dehydrogenase family protein [SAR116 cluster bacterium]
MDFAHYIGGEWVGDSDVTTNTSPANRDDVIGTYARGDAARVDQAVSAALAAQPGWAAASPQLRHDVLERAGALIVERKDELGRLLAREEGKTIAEAVGETVRASQVFKFFAGEALRNTGDAVASGRPGIDVMIEREAVGVIGLITPWNFPIAIPAWKLAPALAYGNAVVMKPAELTPGCAWELAKILHEAGCPAGIFNLVMGPGSKVGARIVEHQDIAAVSFTGSVATGRQVAVDCAARGKKVQLEMGGKNPMVV